MKIARNITVDDHEHSKTLVSAEHYCSYYRKPTGNTCISRQPICVKFLQQREFTRYWIVWIDWLVTSEPSFCIGTVFTNYSVTVQFNVSVIPFLLRCSQISLGILHKMLEAEILRYLKRHHNPDYYSDIYVSLTESLNY